MHVSVFFKRALMNGANRNGTSGLKSKRIAISFRQCTNIVKNQNIWPLHSVSPPLRRSFLNFIENEMENVSPFIKAAYQNDNKEVKRLCLPLTYASGLNSQDINGQTALTIAAMNNNKEMVNDLLCAGAQVDIKDYENMKATDWTLDLEIDEMIRKHSSEAYPQHVTDLEHNRLIEKETAEVDISLLNVLRNQEDYTEVLDSPTELEKGILQQTKNI